MEIIYGLVLIYCLSVTLTVLLFHFRTNHEAKKSKKPESSTAELNIEEEATKAADRLREYCLVQKDEGHCRFNLNENNKECRCLLLENPPEGWTNEYKQG